MGFSGSQTCAVCGRVLEEPTDAVPPVCHRCLANSPSESEKAPPSSKESSQPTTPFHELPRTQIISKDAGHATHHHTKTVNFKPPSLPTEPTEHASDERVSKSEEIGRFRVVGILGRGSFGMVYRAYDPLLDRDVAVKVPRFFADDSSTKERFLREAKAAARLHHPNIVTLFESGQTDEGPFLVVELIDGVPLSQRIRDSAVDLRIAVDWVRQIAEGLHYAHSEGIVHRDIKPANIMLNRAGRPQIMDFGLAKRDADIDAGMTVEGQIVGTPNYMSPEQARGAISEIGPQSDQYSVGVVLYELICGRQPFAGSPWSIISRVANARESVPSPCTWKPDLPRDLEACCLKALEKNPQLRYPDLQAMASDLDRWLNGLPLVARPINAAEQLVRWCRSNRLVASLGATVAVLLLIAAIVGPWLAFRFEELASDAQREAHEATQARDKEKLARLANEQMLIDNYTETGLTADQDGKPREAILWFANAAAAAENHPDREQHNRRRVQSWIPQISVPLQAFEQPSEWIKSLTYHPSGSLLLCLTVSEDPELLLGHAELLRIPDGVRIPLSSKELISAATWSPDGKLLAIAFGSEVVLLKFDLDQVLTADPTKPIVEAPNTPVDRWIHCGGANCLQFSADGQLLVVGGNVDVQVRDVSAKQFRTDAIDIGSQVSAIAVSRDGRRFAVRSEDQQVRLFSCAADQPNTEPLLPNMESASPGILSPIFVGNDRLVVANSFQEVRCWDIEQKQVVWSLPIQRVLTTAMSPNEQWIAIGQDSDVVLLNAGTGERTDTRMNHLNLINSLSFHPQSSRLLTGSEDHTARLFDIPSGQPIELPIPHNKSVHRAVWSPDGATFATVHWGGEIVRVWSPSKSERPEFVAEASASAPFVRCNDRRDRWLPSGFDRSRNRIDLQVLDANTGHAVGPIFTSPGILSDADFVSPSSSVVMVGGGSREDAFRAFGEQDLDAPGFIRFVNAETGEATHADLVTPSQAIAVRTSPDGASVVVLCHRGHFLIVDSATGKPRAEGQAFNGDNATHGFLIRDRIRFSPRGDQFVVWGCLNSAEVRKTSTGELLFVVRHDAGFIHDAQFSPDGRLLATCSSDTKNTVRLWDTGSGAHVGAPLSHAGWVFSAQFTRDGRRLLTASSDKQARIWDLETRTVLVTTREQSDQVFSASFLPEETYFVISTRDGQLSVWDATLGKRLAPKRTMPGQVYQLTSSAVGHTIIASGNFVPSRGFDWRQWLMEPDTRLKREDVRLLGEIISSQRIHEAGAATRLTSAEWIQSWQAFRKNNSNVAPSK